MSKEMNVTIFIHKSYLNEEVINKFIPNEKIFLDVNAKCIKINVDDQEISFNTTEILNVTKSGEYFIELVKAKLSYYDSNIQHNTSINISKPIEHPPMYKCNGVIVQLYLSKSKRNLECKIYNVGNYSDEVPYKYLTSDNTLKELYDLSICNTKKIVNKNVITYREYSDALIYQRKMEEDDNLLDIFFYSVNDKYYIYRKSNKIINLNDFSNPDSYIKRSNERLSNISENIETLLRHDRNFCNYLYDFNDDTEKLITLADKEYDCRKIYCEKGWAGDLEFEEFISYMTYINMHTLNGVIFSDDELVLKELECYAKVDILGQYVCLDNEYSVNCFKKKYNINDDDFKIGKYVIIGPRHLEEFTKDYLGKYVTHILAYKKKDDLLKDYEDFCNEMCKKLTKLTFLHELGHMAFTASNRNAKKESDESAANWFASIGLDVVEKYRLYLKTRIQPVEYQNFFTNTALLPGGKLFENTKDIDKTLKIYGKKDIDELIKYKDECNYEYYKKVKDMIDDMYISHNDI